ncbi:uncharacterized protein B0T23DRAFT_23225 [Neurospora hispaniola]|uniref:Uncharacterized protein n=1 Tax=Neurospora hispaniola TaxID=588809 RepID=A0AAJ0MVW1_9PEZI|nr:hypothetical protein B0T23DRAFT_23225 [Neurospora hispaniola]
MIPCRRKHPVLGCNLHRIPDGRDPAELSYNYHTWACWTESARLANNRSTRLHPSHEMPRSERVLDVLSSSAWNTIGMLENWGLRETRTGQKGHPTTLPRVNSRTDLGTAPLHVH